MRAPSTTAARPRRRSIGALAFLLVAGLAAAAPRLGDDLPPGSPTRATLDGWERIDGQVETRDAHVTYEFYVDPARNGLYTVTRYRRGVKGQGADLRLEDEKYVWNVGRGRPLRCFTRAGTGAWRALQHGSDEYRYEMLTVMSVYALHRQARLGK